MSDLLSTIFDRSLRPLGRAPRFVVFLVGLVVGMAVGYALPPVIKLQELKEAIKAQKDHIETLQNVQKQLTEDKNNYESRIKDYEKKLVVYVPTETYKDFEVKFSTATEKVKHLENEMIKWKGGTFPIKFILKQGEEIKILGDLPIKLSSLVISNDGTLNYAYISSPALGSSSVRFSKEGIKSTSFMHNYSLYTMKVEMIEFERLQIEIDRIK